MKINRKQRKTHLLIVGVSIICITLIAGILNICRLITHDYVTEYNLHIEKISNLEDDTITLAEEFMQSVYDKHWDTMKGCWGRIPWDMAGDYELGSYIIPERYATCFYRNNRTEHNADEFPEGINTIITCYANANDKPDSDKTIMISFAYNANNPDILGHITYHGNNPSERISFVISLVNDTYVADKANLEELTGLTIEEIVETAELNRKGFEDLMYTMKEHELEESKNDLNTSLKNLYTLAAFLIIVLLTVWIVVLIVILKCNTQNRNL